MVQACLCAVKTWYRSFNHRGAAVKHVQARLSARKDRESCFHHYGGAVKHVHVGERPDNAVLTSEEVLCSTCRPV